MVDDQSLNAGDRRLYRNVRDVFVRGSETTCLDCHNAEGPRKAVKKYAVHSALCEY